MIWGIFASITLALSFYVNIYPLVFVALTIFFIYLFKQESNKPNRYTFIPLLLFFLVHNFWLFFLISWEGLFPSIGIYLLSVIYFYLLFYVFIRFIFYFKDRPFSYIWISVSWVIFEKILSVGPFGYTLFSLYLTQAYSPFVPLSYGPMGASAISFLVMASSIFMARIYLRSANYTLRIYQIFLVFFIFLASIYYCDYQVNSKIDRSRTLKVAVLQPAIPQKEKQQYKYMNSHLDYYIRLLRYIKEKVPNLDAIILPESIISDYWEDRIIEKIKDSGVLDRELLIFGLPIKRNKNIYNAVLYYKSGNIQDYYAKHKLVPFAESKFPLLDFFHPQNQIFFNAGKGINPVIIQSVSYGTTICFESLFSSSYSKLRNSNILIVLTDDSWFNAWFKELHLRTVIFRAAENRKYLLFSNNTGMSAIISSYGKIISKLPNNKSGFLIFDVPLL